MINYHCMVFLDRDALIPLLCVTACMVLFSVLPFIGSVKASEEHLKRYSIFVKWVGLMVMANLLQSADLIQGFIERAGAYLSINKLLW